MSHVCNTILAFSITEDVPARIADVNALIKQNQLASGDGFVDSWSKSHDWHGGSKMLERPTFVAAFNYLSIQGLCHALRNVPWERPGEVQLIVCDQEDDEYRIVYGPGSGLISHHEHRVMVAAVEKLKDALRRYGRHFDCPGPSPAGSCKCGLNNLLS